MWEDPTKAMHIELDDCEAEMVTYGSDALQASETQLLKIVQPRHPMHLFVLLVRFSATEPSVRESTV